MTNAFIPQDAEGNLLRVADISHIQEPWLSALEPIKKMYHAHLGNQVRGIYIHGSVARGSAKLHVSDIDAFCLTHTSPAPFSLEWVTDAQRNLERQFPFATKFDLRIGSQEDVEKNLHYTMILKTLSVCIDGQDIATSLPHVQPDLELARFLTRNFSRRLQRGEAVLAYLRYDDEIRANCKWLMKELVRGGFRLVIPRERQYTLHLETAAHTFIKYYPEKKDDMLRAFHLAHNPTAEKAEILSLMHNLGPWLSQEINAKLSV